MTMQCKGKYTKDKESVENHKIEVASKYVNFVYNKEKKNKNY
jgi:hypothetical protein